MTSYILKIFAQVGTYMGWLVAIIQLPMWVINLVRTQRKLRALTQKISDLEEENRDLENEIAEQKDRAYIWFRTLKELLLLTKTRCPQVYYGFIDTYGGEQKFTDWWILPEPPKKIEE